MRHFNKSDRSLSLSSLIIACVLTFITACVAPSGPLGAPNVIQTGAVSSVRMSLAQSTLAPGQTTQATAVATSADGTVVGGRVDFSSQNPSIATVSSNGVVTALTAGVSMIQASVASRAASATVTVESLVSPVPPSTVLAFHDFNDGTKGPYQFLYTPGHFDVIDDPTGSGRGKVARFFYAPVASNLSDDESINPSNVSVPVFRYGYTLWFKGDVYLPSANSSGLNKNSNLRKLIDFKGAGNNRMIIYRQRDDVNGFGTESNNPADSHSAVHMSAIWDVGGVGTEAMAPDCGITLLDDTWYTIEVMLKTNSADGVYDAVVEIYINGSPNPNFRQATGLSWINEYAASNFNFLMIGSQMTAFHIADIFSEYRYWDNVAFSTTRLRP